MKRKLLGASAAILLSAATAACSEPYGPGMMGGYGPGGGPGYGQQGQGRGYGPGYDPAYGPYSMGPGMMGGYYGMRPGMMGGYPMGPGMMWGYGPSGYSGYGYGVDLSAEQRAKLAEIQQDFARKQWEQMDKMHAEGGPMYQAFGLGAFDERAARKAYEQMADARKQMFEAQLEARKKIDAVLTPEQQEQMNRGWRGR